MLLASTTAPKVYRNPLIYIYHVIDLAVRIIIKTKITMNRSSHFFRSQMASMLISTAVLCISLSSAAFCALCWHMRPSVLISDEKLLMTGQISACPCSLSLSSQPALLFRDNKSVSILQPVLFCPFFALAKERSINV
jgi:hypothetical protein